MPLQKPTISIFTHILDDNLDFTLILKDLFKQHPDIEYKIFNKIDEFLKAIQEEKNISIIDYNLKDKYNGIDLMKIVLEKNPNSYVIMMSSQDSLEVVVDFYEAGGFRYLNKNNRDFTKKLIGSIRDAKTRIQNNLDYYFAVVERFNDTKQTLKDAKSTFTGNSLLNN